MNIVDYASLLEAVVQTAKESGMTQGANYQVRSLYRGGHNTLTFIVERLPSDGVFDMPQRVDR